MFARFVSCAVAALLLVTRCFAADWSEEQIPLLPSSESPVRLFNGKDFTGWEGHIDQYFFIENGVIIGKNTDRNAPKSSTYLLTKKTYRNFRLIFESKLVTSEMHSGIALWGKVVTKDEGPFTYQGHLVMYPSGYGYHDLFRRNSIYKDSLGIAKNAGKQHDWNQMEILAIGRRIRHVVNGHLVADWSDPQPELCEEGPIGLQLHSNTVAQELYWRGLILSENPQNRLITAVSRDVGLVAEGIPAESGMNAESLKKIDQRMRELIDAKQAAGIVTLIARRGRIVHFSANGKASIADNRDMAKDSLFAIASMTKPITAAALLIAVDDGKLKLDDPVSKYIPSFSDTKLKGGTKTHREITVRDCLRHTNGLESDQRNTGDLAETADKLAHSELAFEPGSKWLYGPGLSVAGRVLEVATGLSYEQFLQERIFQPLEMHETTFRLTDDQKKRLASLYQPTEDKQNIEPGHHWLFDNAPADIPNPSGGLFSTAGDLVRFHQMILNGGELNGKRVISAASLREMTSLQTAELATVALGVGWGLGFSVVPYPRGSNVSLAPGSFGHGGAFGTQGWIDPDREMIFVLMVARQKFSGPHAIDLRAEVQRLAVESIAD
jgi:CubicO group peptidase (beta-lactamase class C family)